MNKGDMLRIGRERNYFFPFEVVAMSKDIGQLKISDDDYCYHLTEKYHGTARRLAVLASPCLIRVCIWLSQVWNWPNAVSYPSLSLPFSTTPPDVASRKLIEFIAPRVAQIDVTDHAALFKLVVDGCVDARVIARTGADLT